MTTHTSGYYSISDDYVIVGYNDVAKELYPQIAMGEKCHKALMGLDEPCAVCPVLNHVVGPQTYLDPIRHIYETVDAVQTIRENGEHGHALVFSTVGTGAELSSVIPTGENALRLLGAINVLATEYLAIYGVDIQTGKTSVYREAPLLKAGGEAGQDIDGIELVDRFLEELVHPDDRERVAEALDLESAKLRLALEERYVTHCRVITDRLHYYRLIVARNGAARNFKDILVAAICEDDDINTSKIYESQLRALLSKISDAAGFFHLDLTANQILEIGGTSATVQAFADLPDIDELVAACASTIVDEDDRRSYTKAFGRASLIAAYSAGEVEVRRKSRCVYDDGVARISEHTARLIANPRTGHLEAVLYGRDATSEVKALDTQMSIVQALGSNYRNVFLVNTRERSVAVIKNEDGVYTEKGEGFHPYARFVVEYARGIVHPESREFVREAFSLDNVLRGLEHDDEYSGNFQVLLDGVAHHYQFRFIKNEDTGLVVLGMLNIDDMVAAEIEHHNQLHAALEEARRANEAKSTFLASISHDIRTPLNGIIGLLQIDENHADDVEFLAQSRQKAKVSAEHLLSLINDVLDMSKIEDGSVALAHEPVDLNEVAGAVGVLMSMRAKELGIRYRSNIGEGPFREPYVYANPLHLRRVFMNIIGNCLKYNKPNGSVEVRISEVPAGQEGRVAYRWVIEDTGIGMSREFVEHIFEPFSQEKTDARSVYHGTGLGMSIAKSLIEQMSGTLEVASEVGVGSTFTVTVPFEVADASLVEPAPAAGEAGSVEGLRVLLVEDNELNREIAQVILEEHGAEVTCAANGSEAVAAFSASGLDEYDAVLMDIMMPVMDGYEATRRIRRLDRPDAQSVPILAMTANAFAEDTQRALGAGMNAHIVKPINVDVMLSTIASCVAAAR